MIRAIRHRLSEEVVFVVSLALAIGTSFFVAPTIADINWHVLGSLFNLMGAVLGLERVRLFDMAAVRLTAHFKNERSVTMAMVLLTGVSATVVTNDVALICFVPLMLVIARKADFDPLWAIVLQTLAANICSTLTPMGNPQNLFLFSHYQMSTLAMAGTATPFVLSGMALVLLLNVRFVPPHPISFHIGMERAPDRMRTGVYAALFLAGVAGVLHVLPVGWVAAAVLFGLLLLDRPLLRKLDGFLLLTFLCFFIAIGNLTRIPALHDLAAKGLSSAQATYLTGLVLSQGISNVPAALLLAPFTPHGSALFLGVNIGGMGTLIASMASLISYRMYARHHSGTMYLKRFHLVNAGMLVLLGSIFLLFIS